MSGKIIAVDLDEVLGSFVSALCEFHNKRFGTKLKLSDFFSYRFSKVWGGSENESSDKVHEFFKTTYFKELPVVPGARQGLEKLKSHGFQLVVVTSRQFIIRDETLDWIRRNFPPDTFSRVEFGNHWGIGGGKRSKSEICNLVGASVLIDDSLSYTEEVAAQGMDAILFDLDNCYPWNRKDILPDGVTRVSSWDMAVDTILKLA